MVVIRINAEISGEKRLIQRLNNYAGEVDDNSERFESAFLEWTAQNRELYQSRGYGKWDDLTARYAAEKQRRYGFKPIGIRTGRSYYSLTGITKDTVKRIDKYSATFGSSVPYLKEFAKRRPIIIENRNFKRRIVNVFKRDLSEKFK